MLAVGFGAQEDLFSITLNLCGSPWLEHSWEHQEQGKDWGVWMLRLSVCVIAQVGTHLHVTAAPALSRSPNNDAFGLCS